MGYSKVIILIRFIECQINVIQLRDSLIDMFRKL